MVDLISEVVAGFGLKEVSIPEIMKRNKIPVLFIHGDADDYVPMCMTIKNYEACASKKELYIVSGAGHALAFSKDMEEVRVCAWNDECLYVFLGNVCPQGGNTFINC